MAASLTDPRTVPYPRDEVRHGRQPLPSRIGLLSGTLHTMGESAGTVFSPFRQADPYPRPEAERTSSGWRALCFSQYFWPQGIKEGQPGCLHGMFGFDGTASSFPAHKKRASRNDPVTLIHFVSIRIPHLDTACQCKYRLNIVQLSRIGSSQDSIYSSSILSRALYSSFKAAIAVFL